MPWNSERVLANVSKRTGLSVAKLVEMTWTEIEELLGIKNVFTRRRRVGHYVNHGKDRILTKDDQKKIEKETEEFLSKV